MAIKKSSQATPPPAVERLMLAVRRSSAAGVLHSQAVAKKVGVNSTDLECLDLILTGGPATAGEIGRRTGLTSGAVTGLIDRLERQGLVERFRDAQDRRKVLVRVREEAVAKFAPFFEPMAAAFLDLVKGYSNEELNLLSDFAERSTDMAMTRIAALNAKE